MKKTTPRLMMITAFLVFGCSLTGFCSDRAERRELRYRQHHYYERRSFRLHAPKFITESPKMQVMAFDFSVDIIKAIFHRR